MGNFRIICPLFYSPFLKFIQTGGLAITVFFVVSGFALSYKFIRYPRKYSVLLVIIGRYFRLAIPVFCSCLLVYVISLFDLFMNIRAGEIIGSTWLQLFYNFEPSWVKFLKFALFTALFDVNQRQDLSVNYNANLWTMPLELAGSLLIFMLVAILANVHPRAKKISNLAMALLLPLLIYKMPYMACFACGYLLSELYVAHPKILQHQMMSFITISMFITSVIIVSFAKILTPISTTLLAMTIVFSVNYSPFLNRLCSSRISIFLGKISFPLYLIQMIVICTLFSYLIIQYSSLLSTHPTLTAFFILAITMAGALVTAMAFYPIELFSIWMSKYMGNLVARVVSRSGAPRQALPKINLS